MDFLKRKFLTLAIIIIFSIVFSANYLFAYDEVIVHPSLTTEMAKLYNLNYNEKLTDQEIEWIKKGSKDEDMRQGLLIRSGNHFFNPFGVKKWADNTVIGNIVPEPKLTAKEWAHNSLEQDSFPGGDFTWERAIWDYVNGDKQHAYESLGHIMHLIEDSTVPAHVRNDLHISPNDKDLAPYQNLPRFEEIKKALQDGEPYEAWTGGKAWSQNLKFDFARDLFQENKKLIVLNSIDEYFDNIAKYTNTNFFSKDTIYSYSNPKILFEKSEKLENGKTVIYGYGANEIDENFRLAKLDNSSDKQIYIVNTTIEGMERVNSDYWSHLAPRAVLTGAGIIKLFKDEANKAAGNPQSIARPKSIASVYGHITPAIRAADPPVRTIATVAQLQLNAEIYFAKKVLTAVQNVIISAFDQAKSSVVAFYDWGKAQAVAAYDAVKTTTVTVFNKTKTGLRLAKEYAFTFADSAAAKAGDFFNSSAKFVARYFSSSAKAQLEFNISNPLSEGVHSLEDIIKQSEAIKRPEVISIVNAQTIEEPVYAGKIRALNQNQKLSLAPGEEIALAAEIKNIGAAIWQGEKISLNIYPVKSDIIGILPQAELFNGVNIARDFAEKFYHSSWLTKVRPASLEKIKIAPGAIGAFNFIVTAPAKAGDYFFRVRPVWQSESGEFNWLGEDIASWAIRVEPLSEIAAAEEKLTDLPAENKEQNSEAEKPEEEISAAENNLPPEEIIPVVDENIEKEKFEAETKALAETEALAAVEAASLENEEAARLKKEEELIIKRRRAWVSTPPETAIVEFPDNPTAGTAAGFKFSSSKPNSIFYCILDDSEFVSCGEYAVFENLDSGKHILKVKAKDEYGNYDETPEEYLWAIEKAESAPHLVISEIQAGTNENGAEDEFVELYNPTDQEIDLAVWELRKKNSSGKEDNLVDNADFTGFIAPKSFFLIAHKNYKGFVIPDLWYSTGNNFSYANNSVIIYNGDYQAGEIIDEVIYSEISKGQSLERKAPQGGVCVSSQGKGEFLGNACDTDDPSDFEIRMAPNPQNSASIAEPAPTPAHNVTNGLDYPSIQMAIDSANPGDEIQVDSGTYYESININKRLILKGIDTGGGKPAVDSKGSGSAIILSADNITLEGFSAINTANASGGWPIAGILVKSQKNIIKNNAVNSNDNGIVLYYSNNNELTGNEAFDNGNGIYLDYSSDNNLSGNTTNSNNNGIVIASGGNNNLSDNTASSNDRGIYLLYTGGNLITDNNAESNSYGIFLQNSQKNTLTGNVLTGNRASSNNAGIFLEYDSNYNIIAGNGISLNSYGLYFYYAGHNTIYHNNIAENANQAFDFNKNSNAWNNNYPSGGNYWSDYIGVDLMSGAEQDELGGDGIGDAPYLIEKNKDKPALDRYPLMEPYGN